jgi:hypothetical protein
MLAVSAEPGAPDGLPLPAMHEAQLAIAAQFPAAGNQVQTAAWADRVETGPNTAAVARASVWRRNLR